MIANRSNRAHPHSRSGVGGLGLVGGLNPFPPPPLGPRPGVLGAPFPKGPVCVDIALAALPGSRRGGGGGATAAAEVDPLLDPLLDPRLDPPVLYSCRTSGRRVTIPVPRGRKSRPTTFSSTLLFPELCEPITTICGRSMGDCPIALKTSWSLLTMGIKSSITGFLLLLSFLCSGRR